MAEEEIKELEDLPGVGATTAEKLRENGYKTIEAVAVASLGEVIEATGLSEAAAKKAVNAARNCMKMSFETASEVLKKRELIGKLTTGSKELDSLIGGGIETRSITELYARYGVGKTQIAFQASVNVQKPKEQGGLDGAALYIDTEGMFRPERITQMAKAAGMDEKEVLEKIFVARAFSSDHQMLLADKAEEIITKNNIKLVVVDSLTGLFRAEYVGRGVLANRQQKLNRHIHALQKLADIHNLAVIVTNQVMANPGLLFGDPTTPIGGHIVGHASGFRVYLRKGKDEKRIARLVDSPCMPEGECVFIVDEKGIGDA